MDGQVMSDRQYHDPVSSEHSANGHLPAQLKKKEFRFTVDLHLFGGPGVLPPTTLFPYRLIETDRAEAVFYFVCEEGSHGSGIHQVGMNFRRNILVLVNDTGMELDLQVFPALIIAYGSEIAGLHRLSLQKKSPLPFCFQG